MKETTEAKFINKAASVLDQVANNHLPILITRGKGESLVLLSLRGYEAIEKLICEMDDRLSKT